MVQLHSTYFAQNSFDVVKGTYLTDKMILMLVVNDSFTTLLHFAELVENYAKHSAFLISV